MVEDRRMTDDEAELKAAIEAVLNSPSGKKLVIAGPGTGKTTLFRQMLELSSGQPERRIVLTFINNLKDDLRKDLAGLAEVFTLHSYCLGLLYKDAMFRGPLSPRFRCYPGLASLIAQDCEIIEGSEAPQFVGEMRNLTEGHHIDFYLARGEYYDAVDFDDTVYRTYVRLTSGSALPENYDLVLIDEYQDFNRLEAGFIDILGQNNPILIAGDDDQALYSQLRNASWDYIRTLRQSGEYEVFELPFCMRCPKVVVDAVRDVLSKASELHKLDGRIDKPYKYFPPVKGADSARYPKIALVETSVQRQHANYMGRYIAQSIAEIPRDEVEAAARGSYPFALVIVAQPYRDQIISQLESEGYVVDTRREPGGKIDRDRGLSILKEDQNSNLGWRVILWLDAPRLLAAVIAETADGIKRLVDVLPSEFRESVMAEVEAYELTEDASESEQGLSRLRNLCMCG
jgi:hypothetical protein